MTTKQPPKRTPRKSISLTGERIEQLEGARAYFEHKLDKADFAKLTDQRIVSLAFVALEYIARLEVDEVNIEWNVRFDEFVDRRRERHCEASCPCRTRFADAWWDRDFEKAEHDA